MSFLPLSFTAAYRFPWCARQHKLHFPRFRVNAKARSFRCVSSSHKISDFAGTLLWRTSPGSISHSDGYVIFKVHLSLDRHSIAKILAVSRISQRSENALKSEYFHAFGNGM